MQLLSRMEKLTGIRFRELLPSGFWAFSGKLVAAGFSFILTILFARYLSQEVYGQYQLIISLLGTFSIISLPGVATSLLRSIAKGNEGVYISALRLRFRWSLLALPIFGALLLYYFFQGERIVFFALLAVLLVLPLYYISDTWTFVYQAKEWFKQLHVIQAVIQFFHLLLFVVVLLLFPDNLVALVLTYVVFCALANGGMLFYARKKLRRVVKRDDWKSYGFFLTKINILSVLTGRLDYVVVGLVLGPAPLAIYAVGMKVAKIIQDILQGSLTVVTPRIAKKNTLNIKTYVFTFFVTAAIALVAIVLMPWAVTLAFTAKYAGSIYLSQIVLAFLPFFVLNNLHDKHYKYYFAHKKVQFYAAIIGPVLRVVLLFILVYQFGILGLAFLHGARSVLYMLVRFGVHKVLISSSD